MFKLLHLNYDCNLMIKRILILGSTGLIGTHLVPLLKDYEIFTTYNSKKLRENDIHLDVLSEESVKNAFELSRPNIVINLIGIYKNPHFCEQNKEMTMNINGNALRSIAKFSNEYNSYLISFSSDYVFSGEKGNYKENDPASPINHYGFTRVEGEKNIQQIAKDYCIIRTSMVYGKNLVRSTLSEIILNGIDKKLNLISDQFVTPTYLENLCKMLIETM